jgi:hypothetical protein
LSLRQGVSSKFGFSNPGGSSLTDPSGMEPKRENNHPLLKDIHDSFSSILFVDRTLEQQNESNITV